MLLICTSKKENVSECKARRQALSTHPTSSFMPVTENSAMWSSYKHDSLRLMKASHDTLGYESTQWRKDATPVRKLRHYFSCKFTKKNIFYKYNWSSLYSASMQRHEFSHMEEEFEICSTGVLHTHETWFITSTFDFKCATRLHEVLAVWQTISILEINQVRAGF